MSRPRTGDRTCADSRVQMAEVILPNDTNTQGNVLGGRIMHWIDMCAAVSAMRFAGTAMVTASVDELHFLGPATIGEMVLLRAEVTQAWHSSVEVDVQVEAEDMIHGTRRPTTAAYLTFVAVDKQGRPTSVPGLRTLTPAEAKRAREADERRGRRLESRKRINRDRGL